MMFSIAGIIVLLAAVVGTAVLVRIIGSASHRLGRLEAGQVGIHPDLGRVLDQLEALQDEVAALRAESAELSERVDFSERLLAQSRVVPPPDQSSPPH